MNAIGLGGIGTALPERFVPLAELELVSPPERLASFGFDGAWVADNAPDLALTAARRALADAALDGLEVDALLFAGALPQSHQHADATAPADLLDIFCYSASWLQEELGLDRATVCGIAQQGCAGMFSALRTARALLMAEPAMNHVLCVGADVLPPESRREILYNVISDAACATIVSRRRVREKWLGFHQISKGYYWNVAAKQSEIIAAYFPTGRLAITGLLRECGLQPTNVDLVIPTGVNSSSWPILLRLCGIPEDRLYVPERTFGHTIAADSFLLLEQARASGRLVNGMRVLLFAYGFGSSWCALLLEVVQGEEVV